MSGDERPLHQVVLQHATDLGNQAYHAVADTIGGAGRRIGGVTKATPAGASDAKTRGGAATTRAGDDWAPGLFDLANEIAGLLVRTASEIAESVVKAAGTMGTVVAHHPVTSPMLEPLRTVGQAATAPAATSLPLPDATPGTTTAASLVVRNDSRDTLDALRLRCGGLFGPGDLRIGGQHVRFSPVTVDIGSETTADVTCTVDVPSDTRRAHYVGLVEAVGVPGVQLLVVLDVV